MYKTRALPDVGWVVWYARGTVRAGYAGSAHMWLRNVCVTPHGRIVARKVVSQCKVPLW